MAPVEILSNPQCQGHDVDLEMILHRDPTHRRFLPAKDPQHPLAVEGDIPQFGGLDHVFVKLILKQILEVDVAHFQQMLSRVVLQIQSDQI